MRGYTLAELLVTLALVAVGTAMAAPRVTSAMDHWRARSAAAFVASRLAQARAEAVRRNANVGVRFEPDKNGIRMRTYADANGDGVRTADITAGIDQPLGPPDRLDWLFGRVAFGFEPGVTLIDGTPAGPGANPVHVGTANLVVFSAIGAASGGTVYLHGSGGWQYAVVVLAATGRTRTLEWDAGHGGWGDPW